MKLFTIWYQQLTIRKPCNYCKRVGFLLGMKLWVKWLKNEMKLNHQKDFHVLGQSRTTLLVLFCGGGFRRRIRVKRITRPLIRSLDSLHDRVLRTMKWLPLALTIRSNQPRSTSSCHIFVKFKEVWPEMVARVLYYPYREIRPVTQCIISGPVTILALVCLFSVGCRQWKATGNPLVVVRSHLGACQHAGSKFIGLSQFLVHCVLDYVARWVISDDSHWYRNHIPPYRFRNRNSQSGLISSWMNAPRGQLTSEESNVR